MSVDHLRFESVFEKDLEHIRFLQPDGWPDITLEFQRYIRYDFCRPVKALLDSRIIGLGAAISYRSTGWLAHIIVDPDYRNRGIGMKITSELMRILNEKRIIILLLIATELGYPIYLRAGFRVISEYTYMKRESPWTALTTSDRIIPYDPVHQTSILKLDREVSGEDRSDLILSGLDRALLYMEEELLQGYYLPGVGEGPIIAGNDRAGIELMKFKYARTDKAVLPSQNQTGVNFLKSNGFTESGTRGIRMSRGKAVHWQPEKIFSRIGGNFG